MKDSTAVHQQNGLEIAIVGMTGRFPGARNLAEFWQNLRDGVESISWFTDEELRSAGVDPTLFNQPNYVKARATLADVDLFDAPFFEFSPKEAEITDPQHRILLESAWEALEQAGCDPGQYSGLIGVYVGAGFNNYFLNLIANSTVLESVDRFQLMLGNDKDFISTRVSYKLNLQGPSYTVQTACSTSLVAIHLACRSLLSGECDMALAGGIAVQAEQRTGYLHQEGGIASPDGHCRAFDAQAQGTVSGNGVGIVVLKRLDDAIAEGDYIHAVIKGSAINNDGAHKVSYTAPRIDSQAAVIQMAQRIAEVEPGSISYIEAHGTGTALGDPIEIAALTQAFRANGHPPEDNTGFCAIGSLKTNVGHLDTAAGVAGLIKTVLALQHQQIPPSLHFQHPNPQIDFATSPFYVNTLLKDWQSSAPRRAGVSSFGIGGTNAHVILEEAPPREPTHSSRPWQLLLLSAKTDSALEIATANLVTHLKQQPGVSLADVAYTLQIGRHAFAYRRMAVCCSVDETARVLKTLEPSRVITQVAEAGHRSIAFLFPGQGAQYPGMGRELYDNEPTFRQQVAYCSQRLQPLLGIDLRQILYPDQATANRQVETPAVLLNHTCYAQPALFVIEYALTQLWKSWGIQPEVLMGHSIGELVAACVAGVFSLEDALTLVALRGQLMQQCPPGAMLSVPLSEADLQPWLTANLTLAVRNAPSLSVVSGPEDAIAQLHTQLSSQGIAARRLHTSHGFHSDQMEHAIDPFIAAVRQIKRHPPQIPMLSNVTGTWLTAAEATDPTYWGKQLRQTVRFAEGAAALLQDPTRILLEVGPGRTLSTLVRQQAVQEPLIVTSLRHPQQEQSDLAFLLQSLGRLWVAGLAIDWTGFYAHERRQRLPLPTYPFERQRYWLEPQQSSDRPLSASTRIGRQPDPADWFYLPAWKRTPPATATTQTIAEHPGCWLLFVDSVGLGQDLANRLEQANQTVVIVTPAQQFAQFTDRHYSLNPDQAADYDRLLQTLQAHHQLPQHIVHSWSINPSTNFEASQLQGFYSLIYLTQALEKYAIGHSLRLNVVTSHLHEVTGSEPLALEQTTLLGACKVIPQEYPHITCRVIDLIMPEAQLSRTQLTESLLLECVHESSEAIVAYRGTHRWVQTFEPMPLSAASATTSRLRFGGVYLIAGDLAEGLGIAIAQSLMATWHAKVALVGQSGLPVRHQWPQWLDSHAEDDRISRRIRQWQALEATDAHSLLIEADVTDVEQMQQAIAQIDRRFGDLHGVIYTPAIQSATSTLAIAEITSANSQPEFHARIQGLQVLEAVLPDRPLDFCLIQSSLACVLGGLGLATYAASYSYLDAFVDARNRTSTTPWFSLNRQAWHSEWEAFQQQPPTMAATDAVTELTMTPQEVWQAIDRVLAMPRSGPGAGRVVVSTGALQPRIAQAQAPRPIEKNSGSPPSTNASHSARSSKAAYEAPRTDLEQTIATIWQDLLGVEQIGIHDNFFALGGHSLLAIQVTSRLRQRFAVELPLKSILFDAPTIAGLAQIIHENQAQSDGQTQEQENEQAIAALLQDMKHLSPDEIQRHLQNSHFQG